MIYNKDFIHLLVLKSSLIMIFMSVLSFSLKVIFYFYLYLYNILFKIAMTFLYSDGVTKKIIHHLFYFIIGFRNLYIFKFFSYAKMVLSYLSIFSAYYFNLLKNSFISSSTLSTTLSKV